MLVRNSSYAPIDYRKHIPEPKREERVADHTASLCHGMSVRGGVKGGFIPLDLLYDIANVDFETQLSMVYAIPEMWRRYKTDSAWRNKFVEAQVVHINCDCSYETLNWRSKEEWNKIYNGYIDDEYEEIHNGCGPRKPICNNYYVRHGVWIRGKFAIHRNEIDGWAIHQASTAEFVLVRHQINLPELRRIAKGDTPFQPHVFGQRSVEGCVARRFSPLPWEIHFDSYVRSIHKVVREFVRLTQTETFPDRHILVYQRKLIWLKKGVIHRDDGPAMVVDNEKTWYKNGFLHREDGPAIEEDSYIQYWQYGAFISQEWRN